MKKLLFFCLICLFAASSAFAQGKICVKFAPGLGLGIGQEVIGVTGKDKTMENVYGGPGSGIKFNLGAGYNWNKNYTTEIGFEYSSFLSKSWDDYESAGSTTSEKIEVKPTYMGIPITFKLKKPLAQMTPYIGVGPGIYLGGKIITTMTYTGTGITGETMKEIEYKYNMGIGYHGVGGVEFNMNDMMSLFGELKMTQLSMKLAKHTLTKAKSNGQDVLSSMTTNQKEEEYKDSIDPTATNSNTSLTDSKAFSSMAFNVGLMLKF